MPVTPFHLGPGVFFGTIFFKFFNFFAFLLGNVILDIEPLMIIILGIGYPYHRFFHTFLGGLIGAFVATFLILIFKNILQKISLRINLKQSFSFFKVFIGSLLGCWTHVLFDSFIHRDVFPFWPSHFNPLLGLISIFQDYALCVVLGIIGIILIVRKIHPVK
ncbi:hypothetical protein AMJ49_04920 [Parcubacteria bacterium DG_74_2]|nr:MAG: hypothetical protein AMJ49_04920 [Parcubacteria bacterium DG_74_2]